MDCFIVVLDSVWFIIILERKQVSLSARNHEGTVLEFVPFDRSYFRVRFHWSIRSSGKSSKYFTIFFRFLFFFLLLINIFLHSYIRIRDCFFYFMILKYHILTMQHIWFPCDLRQNEPTFLQMYSIFVFSWRSKRKITKWQNTILNVATCMNSYGASIEQT